EHWRTRLLETGWDPSRDGPGGALQIRKEARAHLPVHRPARLEDDDESTLVAVAEMLLEDRSGALGVGPGHREGVREQSTQPQARPAARDERGEPQRKDQPAQAERGAGPANHRRRLRRLTRGAYRTAANQT